MVEATIEITKYCDNSCEYCSTNADEDGGHLPFEKIMEFLDGIEDIERINISGGEPLAHPDFYNIKCYCDNMIGSENVWVYTNAITNLIHNTDVVKEVTVHANVCLHPGNIYISKNARLNHILKLVEQGRGKNIQMPSFSFSRNFFYGECDVCRHILLQADGKVVKAPCKKNYDGD